MALAAAWHTLVPMPEGFNQTSKLKYDIARVPEKTGYGLHVPHS